MQPRLSDVIFSALMVIGAVAIAVAVLTSCAAQTRYESPYRLESNKQRAAAVGVHVSCLAPEATKAETWRGSGVITGRHTVLTVEHAITCHGTRIVHVETADGTLIEAWPTVSSAEYDLARLFTRDPLPWFTFEIGPVPVAGDVVCSETAIPSRGRLCSLVQETNQNRIGEIIVDFVAVRGNSGSGLFDAEGRLVGLASRICESLKCTRFAALWEHRQIWGVH